jgi:hypothetical protein
LKHLEDGVLVDILSVFFDKSPKFIFLRLYSSLQHELGFSSSGSYTGLHLVDLLEFELDYPGAKQHPLGCILFLILVIHTQDCKQVDFKVALLIFGQKFEGHSFKSQVTLCVILSSVFVLTTFEMFLCDDGRDVGSLFTSPAVSEGFLVLFAFQVILPGVLIFALERRNHNLVLGAVYKKHVALDIQHARSERFLSIIILRVDNLSRNLAYNRNIGRIHENDVEQSDRKAGW